MTTLSQIAGSPTVIMPLGDSITQGAQSSDGSGYRGPLYGLLSTGGYFVEFVGSLTGGPFAQPDHEGHGGFAIAAITASAASWISANPSVVILLMIGTNDCVNATDLVNAPSRLGTLLDTIHTASSTIETLVSRIPPHADATINGYVTAYNDTIGPVISAKAAAGYNVRFVDATNGFDAATDLNADEVHPNDDGYDVLAAGWYAALLSSVAASSVELRQVDTYADMVTGDLFAPMQESWLGIAGKGVPFRQTGVVDSTLYAVAAKNTGTGGLSLIATSGDGNHQLRVTNSGTVVGGGLDMDSFDATGNGTVHGSLTVSTLVLTGNITVGGSLTVSGAITGSSLFIVAAASVGTSLNAASLGISGNAIISGNVLASTLNTVGGATVGNALIVSTGGMNVLAGGASLVGGLNVTGTSTLVGNLIAQNASGTVLLTATVTSGAQTLTVGSGTTPPVFVDIANGRTQFGNTTALGSAGSSLVEVIGGRAYIQSGERLALGLRNGLSNGTVYIGATSSATPSISFSGNGGGEIFSVSNIGLATVVSGVNVLAGGAAITGALTVTGSGISATAGSSIFNGVTIATGGVTVQAGGLTVSTSGVTISAGGIGINNAIDASYAVKATGNWRLDGITTSGTAGAVIGYWVVNLAGTDRKIAIYATA